MSSLIVLSSRHAQTLLHARANRAASVSTSLDLGMTSATLDLLPDHLFLPDGQSLTWDEVEEIAGASTACYRVQDSSLVQIRRFSEAFNRFYSLMPTSGPPTLMISGVLMHRIKNTDPRRDTLSKIRTIKPVTGQVLDTCTGLGYTAIEAAMTAERVVTIELDPEVLEIARCNPWSQSLFDRPNIQQLVGDAFDLVYEFDDGSFDRIVHDPPMFNLAGDLYSGEFYEDLYRVLRRKGRLFHYVGDPESRSGRNVTRGVVRRLQETGFSRIVRRPGAFGVVAYK